MTGKLITLPIRVWLQSARLLTRAAAGVAGRAASLAGQTIGAVTPDRRDAESRATATQTRPRDEQEPAGVAPPRAEPTQPEPTQPEPTQPEPTQPEPVAPTPTAPILEEDVHVSEEPELVREVAEPGAEDGAGAAVTVEEPWSGYRHMTAQEVITRARQGSRAELAAVKLYESRHRSRQTVLDAVDRQLKLGNGADPA